MSLMNKDDLQSLDADELRRRIGLLEETLTEKETTGSRLQRLEERYRRLFESAQDGILILDAESGKIDDANPYMMRLLGYSNEDLIGKHLWEIGVFKDIAASKEAFKHLQENEYIRYKDLPLQTSDGRPISVEFVSNVYLVNQSKVIQCNIREITAQKQAEAENKRLSAAIEQAGESIVMTDAEGNIQFVNPAFERTTGYSRAEAVGRNMRILKSGLQDDAFYRELWKTISGGETWTGRVVNKRKDGTLCSEEMTISPVRDELGRIVNYVAIDRDITEQLRMTAQLQQAQKMEAVGRLAGGVAHDFNNMLSVIVGCAEMALLKSEPADERRADLEEILKAADRSAEITRQLLAFARKQTIKPVPLDLNENVEGMLKLLRRLIGEDIDLAWRPMTGSCAVKMDPVQLNQILANLCVNARDAIKDIGKVTIETGSAAFDKGYVEQHAGFIAGDYALLAVSDDGCGMSKDIVEKIFDPFFTTKELGRGTGLGLSIVYGIVKQNDGFINVYSEPEKGTTFRIYLPRIAGDQIAGSAIEAAEPPRGRGETVLVAEDEAALLKMSMRMLEDIGYRVLPAGTCDEAIRLATEHSSEIRLLIADVIMPKMNGRELSERLLLQCPGLKILFMSGYTTDVIAHRGVLDEGVNFLQKPFSIKDLAFKVREAIGEAPRETGA